MTMPIGYKHKKPQRRDYGDIRLELCIDEGDMTNNWVKVTELIDIRNFAVTGGDNFGRDATDTIDEGTRASFRADNMLFDFKKLSVREIVPTTTTTPWEGVKYTHGE